MAVKNLTITQADVNQLKSLLSQIASLADLMSDKAGSIIIDGCNSTTNDAVIIDKFAKTVGWMADYGTSLVGGGQGFKGPKAENWLLSDQGSR